jgi:O-antigen/teichoic acid export membrane protein
VGAEADSRPVAHDREPLFDPIGPVPSSVEQPVDSSNARAVRGGAFAISSHVVVQVLRMVGQMILTRLLPQEAFGVMALVYSFRGMIDLFSDIGIGPSIIQNPRGDDPRFLDTAWTLQLGRGIGLFLFASACALPMAVFYGHPEIAWLIPVSSVAGIIAGLRSTKAAIAERHMILGWISAIEVIAQVAALLVMVIWALLSPSVWALVVGGLVGACVDVGLGYLLLGGYNAKLGWDKTAVASLMHFGKWVFLSTVLTYTVTEADRLVFGKMVTLAELGVYHVALTIASIPLAAMHSVASKVIFPLFSRVNQAGEQAVESLADVFRQARRLHLVVSGWALAGFIGGGPAAVGLIYDDRYADGGWMLQLLAVGAWLSTPEATNSSAALAVGQPRWLAFGNFAKLVGMVLLLPIGYKLDGFRGALIAYAATELFRYAASTLGAYRRGLRTLSQDVGFTLVVIGSSLCALFVLRRLQELGVHVALQALAVFVVTTLLWLPWLMPYLRDAKGRLERRFGR